MGWGGRTPSSGLPVEGFGRLLLYSGLMVEKSSFTSGFMMISLESSPPISMTVLARSPMLMGFSLPMLTTRT